ncbi:MAG: amidohydrolase family protein [Candidatus Lustribacter sp.]|jgi:imidazolonepropionase-like amidohydrolase
MKLVLNGTTIVDPHDGALTRHASVMIDGGKIVQIVTGADAAKDGAAEVIDARGKFVVPGFLDLHAHPLSSSDPPGNLTLMLANGVTGFREMASTPAALAARQSGTLLSDVMPELLEMAGEILTPANAPTSEAVVAEIAKQHAAGADFIKVIDVRPDVFFAALAESTRLGLRFIGHLPPSVDVREAASAGMRSIEHLGPRDSILLGCSTDEPALRAHMAQNPPKPPPISGPIPESVVRRVLANPTIVTPPPEFERYARVVDTFSAERCQDLAAHFVATGMWLCPTLIRIRTMELGDDPAYRDDPNLRYVPPQTRQMWEDVSQQFASQIPAPARATLKALFARQLQLVKPLKGAGVKMLAGSDLGGGFIVGGFGLHAEFDLLEAAGLSPLDVLQMTTSNGAEFLGRESRMGSVAAGKDANLVLLDANPLESVQNLHRIAGVVRAGTYYPRAALEELKKKTEARMAAWAPTGTAVGPPCC